MTAEAETTAMQRLSTVDWDVDGAYLYSRAFTQLGAKQIRADLGEYAVVALGLVLTEGDRKVMMRRSQAEKLFAVEQLPLNIIQRGIAV